MTTFVGWGMCLLKLFKIDDRIVPLGEMALCGLFILVIVGGAVNLFAPLSVYINLLWPLIGCVVVIYRAVFDPTFLKERAYQIGFAALLLIPMWIECLLSPMQYDTGLYHLPSMLWMHNQPLSVGLGNLIIQLGYPDLWHTLCAMFWLPHYGLRGPFLVDGTLLLITLMVISSQALRITGNQNRSLSGLSGLYLIAVLFVFHEEFFNCIGCPASDLPGAAFTTLSALFAFRILLASELLLTDFLLLSISAGLALMFKLSQIPIGLMCLACVFKFRDPFLSFARRWKYWSILLFTISVYTARNVVTSGCLLFPFGGTCMPELPWAMPKSLADLCVRIIRSWSRAPMKSPDVVEADWSWFDSWWPAFAKTTSMRVCAGLLVGTLILIAVQLARKKITPVDWRINRVHLLTGIVGMLFWFFKSPDLRFGYGFFLIFITAALMLPLLDFFRWMPRGADRAISVAVILIFVGKSFTLLPGRALTAETAARWPLIPKINVTELTSRDGSKYFKAEGESDQCWDTPPPCSPKIEDRLQISHWGTRSYITLAPAASK